MDWAIQIWQAKNLKTTKFGSKKNKLKDIFLSSLRTNFNNFSMYKKIVNTYFCNPANTTFKYFI